VDRRRKPVPLTSVCELYVWDIVPSGSKKPSYLGTSGRSLWQLSMNFCDRGDSIISLTVGFKLHVQILRNFMYVLTMAVAWFPSDDNAISYLLLVCGWLIFSHNGASGPESKTMLCFVEFGRRQHHGRSMISPIALFRLQHCCIKISHWLRWLMKACGVMPVNCRYFINTRCMAKPSVSPPGKLLF